MKVLITTPDLTLKGGVSNYYRVLYSYLPANVDYFTACQRNSEGKMAMVKRIYSDYKNFRQNIDDYDVVHLNPSLGYKAVIRDGLFLRVAKKKGKKIVVFFHGWNKKFESKLKHRWLWLFKKYYFQADAIIVLASDFKKKLVNWGFDEKKIFLETTCLDDQIIEGSKVNALKKDYFRILFLSRVVKSKGIYEVLSAFQLLRQKHSNTLLNICGDGEELEKVKEYTRKRSIPNVNFLGYVEGESKYDCFRQADCYLFPTYYGEGMPTSVIEAMAFGLPVITRPVGGLKDFFEDGKMGFITSSFQPSVYANLIEKLIENRQLREDMAQFNYYYAKKHFMASEVARRFEHIYLCLSDSQ